MTQAGAGSSREPSTEASAARRLGRDAPAISVLVPFFDSERFLVECVESLLAQEPVEGGYEVLLIDNGSRDGSRERLAPYEDAAELTILSEGEPGAYAARNAGLAAARSPLIAFTDADCRAAPDWLRTLAGRMEDPGVGVLVGHCSYPGEASWALRLLGAWENAKAAYVAERCLPAQQFAYANNMAVRASVFREIGPFVPWRRAGDTELVHRMAERLPHLRLAYCDAMRVTHLEFTAARARIGRLGLYTKTNSKIPDFEELRLLQRLAVLGRMLRRTRPSSSSEGRDDP